PQKEAPSPDEQAQAQEALEGQSSQEAHLAEVSRKVPSGAPATSANSITQSSHRVSAGGFLRLRHQVKLEMSCQVGALRDGPEALNEDRLRPIFNIPYLVLIHAVFR